MFCLRQSMKIRFQKRKLHAQKEVDSRLVGVRSNQRSKVKTILCKKTASACFTKQRLSIDHFKRSDKVYSPLGTLETLRYSTMDAINEVISAKYRFTKSVLFTLGYFKSVLQKSLGFLPDFLYSSYLSSLKITSISISGAVMTLMISILCS